MYRNMRRKAFLVLLLLAICVSVKTFCVPAYPYPIDYRQSDKTTVNITMRGDEKVFWALSSDGYVLLRAENGDFVYAVSDGKGGMLPSSVLVHNPNERSQEENAFTATLNKDIFYSREQISYLKQIWEIGEDFAQRQTQSALSTPTSVETYKMVVILMGFSDLAFETSRESIDALFNQVGYSVNGHQGSVHDYFMASSNGRLNVEATVVGPYTASDTMAYYGQNYPGTNTDMNVRDLVREAIEFANPEVDFSQFTNGEGNEVSCVYVIYAGVPASAGNDPNTIWPHRSILGTPYGVDGVYVNNYGVSSEKEGSSYYPQPMVIGTICHEFSHVLGQADYYDTDYSEQGSFADHGEWDLMCSGNYNNGGKCPPLWTALEKSIRGYVQLEEISESGSYTLFPLHQNAKAYKMSFTSSEYFLIENRQQQGWDGSLPGHGLLIFHVNENTAGWNMNCANCNPNSPGMDLEEANSNPNYRAGNPFPGSSNKTSFTDNTTPSSKAYSGAELGRPITHITENTATGAITFLLGDEDASRPAVTTLAADGFADSIRVSARLDNGQSLAIIERGVCFSDTTDAPTISCNTVLSSASANEFSATLQGLQPSTEYYVRAYARTSNKVGYGEVIRVKTSCYAKTEYPFAESFEPNNTSFNCWEQEFGFYVSNKWAIADSAYENGGISSAAEGSSWAFIRSDWQNGTQTTKLVSNPLDLSNLSQAQLKFSYAQKAKSGSQDCLRVYYKSNRNDDWSLLQSYTSEAAAWTEVTIDLPEASSDYYIAFEAVLRGGYGVCLDNVRVVEGDLTAFPDVRTLSYDKVTDIAAEVNASLVSAGNNPVYALGICYSTTANPTIDDAVIQVEPTNSFSVALNGLQPATTYFVRAFARNNGHIAYGQELQINTRCERVNSYPYNLAVSGSDNCVETNGWTYSESETSYNFSASTANATEKLVLPIFNLEHFDNTSIAFDHRQEASASSNPDILKVYCRLGVAGEWTLLSTMAEETNGYKRDTIDLTNLSSEYYIAFEGVSNLSSISLKNITLDARRQIPVVVTNEPTLASHNSITASGEVTYEGTSNVSRRGICWATSEHPTIDNATSTTVELGAGLGTFSTTLTNLAQNTTYHIRAFAVNSFGTVYGEEYQVSTLFNPILNNTIAQDQTICEGTVGDNLTGSVPTGGDGSQFSYQWIMSTDGETWYPSTLSSLSTAQNLEMRQLFTTTHFRRVVYTDNISDTSNTVTITVNPSTLGGNVFLVSENPTTGQPMRLQLRASRGSVIGWEKRRSDFNWESIPNSADSVYFTEIPAEGGSWDYRALLQSGVCESDYSGFLTVNIQEGVGLDEVSADKTQIKLIPNPSNGNVSLICSRAIEDAQLSVVAMDGKVLVSQNALHLSQGENRFDLTALSSASYVLRVKAKDFSWETVLIIKH